MQLRYDEDFIEAAMFVCANGPRKTGQPFASGEAKGCRPHSLQIARFQREREKLYAILDPDERNTAFFNLHLDWFREWGLERPILDMLGEFHLEREGLTAHVVRQARGKYDEGAEFHVDEAGGRTGILALWPDQFTADDALGIVLRHEFRHLHDLLNPAFACSPELDLPVTGLITRTIYAIIPR